MKVTVRLFGPQSQLAGQNEVAIELDEQTPCASDVLVAIGKACPALCPSLEKSRLAVDFEIVEPTSKVTSTKEVALIGMLGGG